MNEETRLILYSLKWLIERHTFESELRNKMNTDISNAIVDLINPKEDKPISEETKDTLSECVNRGKGDE